MVSKLPVYVIDNTVKDLDCPFTEAVNVAGPVGPVRLLELLLEHEYSNVITNAAIAAYCILFFRV